MCDQRRTAIHPSLPKMVSVYACPLSWYSYQQNFCSFSKVPWLVTYKGKPLKYLKYELNKEIINLAKKLWGPALKAVILVIERSEQHPLPPLLETAHPPVLEAFFLSLWEMSLCVSKLRPLWFLQVSEWTCDQWANGTLSPRILPLQQNHEMREERGKFGDASI